MDKNKSINVDERTLNALLEVTSLAQYIRSRDSVRSIRNNWCWSSKVIPTNLIPVCIELDSPPVQLCIDYHYELATEGVNASG